MTGFLGLGRFLVIDRFATVTVPVFTAVVLSLPAPGYLVAFDADFVPVPALDAVFWRKSALAIDWGIFLAVAGRVDALRAFPAPAETVALRLFDDGALVVFPDLAAEPSFDLAPERRLVPVFTDTAFFAGCPPGPFKALLRLETLLPAADFDAEADFLAGLVVFVLTLPLMRGAFFALDPALADLLAPTPRTPFFPRLFASVVRRFALAFFAMSCASAD